MEYTIERIFNYLLQKARSPFKWVQEEAHLFQDPSLDLLTGEEKILMHRFVEGCGYKLGLWNWTI